MARLRQTLDALRIGHVDVANASLFDVKRVWLLAAWFQIVLVVGLFVATVLCTHAEHRQKGTVFGFPGPAFNVLIAPIYEELIFRGWILSKLVRKHSNTVAIAVSAALFGVLHIRNIYWLDTPALARSMAFTGLLLGPALGYVTLRSRSVWPAVILHQVNNLIYYIR